MNSATFTNTKAVLLDIDGTLIDSNDAHAKAWQEALDEAGIQCAYSKIRSMIGMGGDHLLPLATGILEESPEGARISKRRGEIFRQKYLPALKAFPMARELLIELKEKNIEMVVATSASEEDLQKLLRQAGLEDLLPHKTSSADVESSKPSPEIIEAALKKISVPRNQTLMIGDTPYDMEAAQKAGVQAIGVTCGGWSAEELVGALDIYQGPEELLEAVRASKNH